VETAASPAVRGSIYRECEDSNCHLDLDDIALPLDAELNRILRDEPVFSANWFTPSISWNGCSTQRRTRICSGERASLERSVKLVLAKSAAGDNGDGDRLTRRSGFGGGEAIARLLGVSITEDSPSIPTVSRNLLVPTSWRAGAEASSAATLWA
jgi:hypothetical protein